jgi:hypothetical protein
MLMLQFLETYFHLGRVRAWIVKDVTMKRSRAYKNYPDLRNREMRTLAWALVVGSVAAGITGLVIYFANHSSHY